MPSSHDGTNRKVEGYVVVPKNNHNASHGIKVICQLTDGQWYVWHYGAKEWRPVDEVVSEPRDNL